MRRIPVMVDSQARLFSSVLDLTPWVRLLLAIPSGLRLERAMPEQLRVGWEALVRAEGPACALRIVGCARRSCRRPLECGGVQCGASGLTNQSAEQAGQLPTTRLLHLNHSSVTFGLPTRTRVQLQSSPPCPPPQADYL